MEKTLTIHNDHFYDFPGSTSSKSYITSNQESLNEISDAPWIISIWLL